jgi:2'-5' RNA ligase
MGRRLFVAVRPPDDVLAGVEAAAAPARRAIVGPRWTTPDQWHLTLQFLGSVPDDAVDDVARALESVSIVRPFPVRLGGGGAFPKASRARVIWLGVHGGGDALAELAGTVGRALSAIGAEPEDRAYQPHLTLARLRAPGDVTPAVAALGEDPVGPAFTVVETVLYESRTRRTGAVYEPVARIELVG